MLERELVYRRDVAREWSAQVYAPEGLDARDRRPLLVDVHGGAWSGGNRFAGRVVDRALVERLGIVVVAIDFRIAPEDPYPAMVQDVNYAVRWVKAHAVELGGRADSVGAIGWSSGGHLAVLAALKPEDARYGAIPLEPGGGGGEGEGEGTGADVVVTTTVDARLDYVVACWPPLDPRARYRFARETRRDELVRNSEGCFGDEDGMWEASAERVVSSGEATDKPPMLIVQGTADGNIPLPMIERFVEAYRRAGGEVRLELHAGQPHGFIMRPVAPEEDARRGLDAIVEFVGQQIAERH